MKDDDEITDDRLLSTLHRAIFNVLDQYLSPDDSREKLETIVGRKEIYRLQACELFCDNFFLNRRESRVSSTHVFYYEIRHYTAKYIVTHQVISGGQNWSSGPFFIKFFQR